MFGKEGLFKRSATRTESESEVQEKLVNRKRGEIIDQITREFQLKQNQMAVMKENEEHYQRALDSRNEHFGTTVQFRPDNSSGEQQQGFRTLLSELKRENQITEATLISIQDTQMKKAKLEEGKLDIEAMIKKREGLIPQIERTNKKILEQEIQACRTEFKFRRMAKDRLTLINNIEKLKRNIGFLQTIQLFERHMHNPRYQQIEDIVSHGKGLLAEEKVISDLTLSELTQQKQRISSEGITAVGLA